MIWQRTAQYLLKQPNLDPIIRRALSQLELIEGQSIDLSDTFLDSSFSLSSCQHEDDDSTILVLLCCTNYCPERAIEWLQYCHEAITKRKISGTQAIYPLLNALALSNISSVVTLAVQCMCHLPCGLHVAESLTTCVKLLKSNHSQAAILLNHILSSCQISDEQRLSASESLLECTLCLQDYSMLNSAYKTLSQWQSIVPSSLKDPLFPTKSMVQHLCQQLQSQANIQPLTSRVLLFYSSLINKTFTARSLDSLPTVSSVHALILRLKLLENGDIANVIQKLTLAILSLIKNRDISAIEKENILNLILQQNNDLILYQQQLITHLLERYNQCMPLTTPLLFRWLKHCDFLPWHEIVTAQSLDILTGTLISLVLSHPDPLLKEMLHCVCELLPIGQTLVFNAWRYIVHYLDETSLQNAISWLLGCASKVPLNWQNVIIYRFLIQMAIPCIHQQQEFKESLICGIESHSQQAFLCWLLKAEQHIKMTLQPNTFDALMLCALINAQISVNDLPNKLDAELVRPLVRTMKSPHELNKLLQKTRRIDAALSLALSEHPHFNSIAAIVPAIFVPAPSDTLVNSALVIKLLIHRQTTQ